MIEVYKFGGASVKDAAGVQNLANILKLDTGKKPLVVVSAMGKTTNKLEALTRAYIRQEGSLEEIFSALKAYHEEILNQLFEDKQHPVFDDVANTFVEIDWIIEDEPHEDEDFIYDQIVSIGELVSSKIVSAYLNYCGIGSKWLDARSFIHTDNTYREGQVDWDKTRASISQLPEVLSDSIVVTQGFIGGTSENYTTTLGREGSDYSAAIFASCLKASSVTIWKDVPGILNADPKLFKNTVKYDELSYNEALEMTYYGATVIHPKTIKPLQNAAIPLFVKPFMAPQEKGTVIQKTEEADITTPAIILKANQMLISLTTKDVSFITENHLSRIFSLFAEHRIKINMLQISAISFSACGDWDEQKFNTFRDAIENEYMLKYNIGLHLITVRHFKEELLKELTAERRVLVEQLSRNTAQFVVKND